MRKKADDAKDGKPQPPPERPPGEPDRAGSKKKSGHDGLTQKEKEEARSH